MAVPEHTGSSTVQPPATGARPVRAVQSVSRALTALTLIGDAPSSVARVAQELGIDKSSASRLLATLELSDFVRRDNGTDGAYTLGPEIGRLGSAYFQKHDPMRQIIPVLEEIAASVGETVSLSVFNGQEPVCVDKWESPHNLRTSATVGQAIPLHAGASGKSVLAYLDEDVAKRLVKAAGMPAFTSHTITDWRSLREELAAIRARGYAASLEEIDHGIGGIGVALRDSNGSPTGAVSITAPLVRLDAEQVETYGRLLQRRLERMPFVPLRSAGEAG